MFNCSLRPVCSVFVLLSGLISCTAKEKVVSDNFKAEPPRVVRPTDSIELKELNSSSMVDLQDKLDFSKTGGTSGLVTSSCRWGEESREYTYKLDQPSQAYFFQFLYPEWLKRNFTESQPKCSFQITVYNEIGSRHIFSLGETKLVADSLKAEPPQIVRPGETLEFKALEIANPALNLDLQDQFDFSISGVATGTITSHCKWGEELADWSIQMNSPKLVSFSRLIPLNWIARDYSVSQPQCSFEISVINRVGTPYTYRIRPTSIGFTRPGAVNLEFNNTLVADAHSRFKFESLTGFQLRFGEIPEGQAQLVCGGAYSHPQDFSSVLRFSDFNLESMNVVGGLPENFLVMEPLQLCRAVVLESGVIRAISNTFELQFPRAAVTISQPLMGGTGSFHVNDTGNGVDFPIEEFALTNTTSANRYVRVPKKDLSVQVSGYLANESGAYYGAVKRFAVFVPKNNEGVIRDEVDHYLVLVPPMGEARFQLRIRLPSAGPRCSPSRSSRSVNGTAYRVTESALLTELNSGGSELGQMEIGFPFGRTTGAHTEAPSILLVPFTENPICDW